MSSPKQQDVGDEINLKTDEHSESNHLPGLVHHRMSNGLFHFYPYRAIEEKFPGGVPETFFQGSQGLKSCFQGG